MVRKLFRNTFFFIVFVLIQVLFLNNIYYLRIATPFLYLYCLIKLPVGTSRTNTLIISFVTGLVIDMFSNTFGMHAAACTFAGFYRDTILNFLTGKDLPNGCIPSFRTFGARVFLRYIFLFVILHHTALFLLEAFTLFDPLFLSIRIISSIFVTTLLICIVDAFNLEVVKYDK